MFRAQKSLYDLTAANLLMETYISFVDILSSNTSLPLKHTPLFGEKQLAHAIELGRVPNLISDWPGTLPQRIDQVALVNPDKTALMDGIGNSLTYSDMVSRIEAIGEALQNAGIGAGSRVLVFQQAASDWICSMLAIMRIGSIYVPLDLRNPLPRLAAVADDFPWSKRGDPLDITKIVQEHSITYNKATPSEYSLWMQYGGDNLRQAAEWRFAFGGGEPLTSTVTNEFADLDLQQLHVFNSYGPTEIFFISSTKMIVEYHEKKTLENVRTPCGYSLPNYTTYVVDEQLKPLPAGMPGEVCIGGAGVSLGYLNNKELTNQYFVPDQFASPEYVANGWMGMYRTGAIGHLQDDGAMVFHSRMVGDTQIKIRGLRLELCDIESNIISAAGGVLREAIVTLREGDTEFLIAHVVFASQHDITVKETFLEHLLSHLPIPQYMIPVAAIPLDQLPLINHSKVDWKAIKNVSLPQRAKSAQEDVELTETMVQLKRVWQDILRNKELSIDSTPSFSFFLVGGNSLLVIRLQSRICPVFNVVVRLVDLLGAHTLSQMARKIEESSSVDLIDWDEETAPPSIPSILSDGPEFHADQSKTKTVLVTGGTGFLANEGPRELLTSSKIVSHGGDLSTPLLGLSEDQFRALSSQVDVILHMGAVRSFWDNYNVLRPSNVHPTKELVKLAAPRRIPIHYISAIDVLPKGKATADAAVSAAAYIPLVDGTDGYVASRWASECILERSTASLGVSSSIYRFLPAAQQPSSKRVLDELVRFVDVSGLIPDLSGWEGRMDMVPAERAADWLSESILFQQPSNPAATVTTRFSHYESPISINVAEMRTYIEEQRGDRGLEQMPGLKWIGRIKALGFKYFLIS
ncbi:MAG: hypothetical protein Q9166_007578 [cf. Caloplaca sp. 2 TL-2023]